MSNDSESDLDSDNVVPVEPVNYLPQESLSHDSSEVADQPQASPEQLEQSEDEAQQSPRSQCMQ